MSSPYSVLGVSPNAADDEIRAAYKELARKYHPDNYVNNPLSDLAAEKMKEINAAYDDIVKLRAEAKENPHSRQEGPSGGGAGYNYGGADSRYTDIRRLISLGRIAEADEILNGIPVEQQDAEWHFLKGQTLYARGWLDDAIRHIQTAALLKPGNPEYQAAVRQFTAAQQGYAYDGRNYAQCSTCDLCTTMMCLNCLCNGRICC